jgi:hypothetical protein
MNKMILRVTLALGCLALLAMSLGGQTLTGGCSSDSTNAACVSCCNSQLCTTLSACLKAGGKDLCSCLAGAFTTEGSCLTSCPPPPKDQGPSCNNPW